MLGFTAVYDYMPSKVDWIAHGLPVEGEWDQGATARGRARDDVATCRLDARAGELRAHRALALPGSRLCSPTTRRGGRVRKSALGDDDDARAEELMEPGPSTVRAHVEASVLARRLAERELATAVIITPQCRLIGVARREDLQTRALPWPNQRARRRFRA